jgi:hypothetical protein
MINLSPIKKFFPAKSIFLDILIMLQSNYLENYFIQIKLNDLAQQKMVEMKSNVNHGLLAFHGLIFIIEELNHP